MFCNASCSTSITLRHPRRISRLCYDYSQKGSTMPEGDVLAEVLCDWAEGDDTAYGRLFSHVYTELKRVAHNQLRKEPSNPLLQTTGLVHEAFLRLRSSRIDWQNEQQFYAV